MTTEPTEPTKTLRVVFRLLSPLCIARRPTAPGQPIETLEYISGTVVRGALATAWLQGRRFEQLEPNEQEQFRDLFLSQHMVFGNGLPLPEYQPDVTVEVVPQTAWCQKYDNVGWSHDVHPRTKKRGKGVFDQLQLLLCGQDPNTGREGEAKLDRFDKTFAYCEENHYKSVKTTPTNATTTPTIAYCEGKHYKKVQVSKRLITRTAINSKRGVAQERFLYTLEALETGQQFSSTIRGPEAHIAAIQQVLQAGLLVRMGQARSRGLGEVKVERVEESIPKSDSVQDAMAKGEAFTQMVRARAECLFHDEHGNLLGDDMLLLPVTLESDVLLRDNYLLPSSDPRPTVTLGRYCPLPSELIEHMHLHQPGLVQSSHWIGGWDELRRVPRSPQLAISMRSVWTFRVPQAHLEAAVGWWVQAQRQGLGERRNEGYGRVRLCHTLHTRKGKQ